MKPCCGTLSAAKALRGSCVRLRRAAVRPGRLQVRLSRRASPAPPCGCPAWTFASPLEPSCKSGLDVRKSGSAVRLSGLDVRKSAWAVVPRSRHERSAGATRADRGHGTLVPRPRFDDGVPFANSPLPFANGGAARRATRRRGADGGRAWRGGLTRLWSVRLRPFRSVRGAFPPPPRWVCFSLRRLCRGTG